MIPPYLKPTSKKRKRPCGRKHGHKGVCRKRPETVTAYQTHTLDSCPDCHQPLQNPVRTYKRYIEDIPPVKPVVTEHTVHGYWCACCKKIVQSTVTDALPNARIGLRLIVFTAWLHYLVGVSVNNIVKLVLMKMGDGFRIFQLSHKRWRFNPGMEGSCHTPGTTV